jgi:hypothetical protein
MRVTGAHLHSPAGGLFRRMIKAQFAGSAVFDQLRQDAPE